MVSTRKLLLAVTFAVSFLCVMFVGACDSLDTVEAPETGSISAASSMPGPYHDVVAVQFDVIKPFQECGLAEPIQTAIVPLEKEMLPDWLLTGAAGENHPFSDELFVLEPGRYKVCATPLKENGRPSRGCEMGWAMTRVHAGMTSEVFIVMQCEGDPNGALDAVGMLNDPPIIEDLDIEDSKFITVCESAEILATASDLNGDDVFFHWNVVNSPPRAIFELIEKGDTAVFSAETPGRYMLRVVAYDIYMAATALKFPIYVSDAVCETDSETETGCPRP